MKNGEDVVGQHPKKKALRGALLGAEMTEEGKSCGCWVGVGVIESLNLLKTNKKKRMQGHQLESIIFSTFPVWCDV